MSSAEGFQDQEQESWLSDDDELDDFEKEEDLECPAIRLTKEEKARIRRPWKHTLIIKLLGRRIGFTLLLRKIRELWRPKAAVDLVALDNGFFLTKFSSKDDYEYVMLGGP